MPCRERPSDSSCKSSPFESALVGGAHLPNGRSAHDPPTEVNLGGVARPLDVIRRTGTDTSRRPCTRRIVSCGDAMETRWRRDGDADSLFGRRLHANATGRRARTSSSLISSLIHLRPETFGAHHLQRAVQVAYRLELLRTVARRLGKRVGRSSHSYRLPPATPRSCLASSAVCSYPRREQLGR